MEKHNNGRQVSISDQQIPNRENDASGIPAFYDFERAGSAILKFLHERMGFNLWMITRVEGDDWIILKTDDQGYGLERGTMLRWADSFCYQMVQGRGPQIAPCSASVSAYASAPITKQLKIGAYVGAPLTWTDGSLFGTLCAIDPEPQPELIKAELPLVELLSRLLGGILNAEYEINKQARLTERAETEAFNDPVTGLYNPVTGLYNRNGWLQLLEAEESRCYTYGSPAWVVSIQLSGWKQVSQSSEREKLILKVSQVLFEATHEEDVIAQVGEDEFAILAVECNAANAERLLERLNRGFVREKISTSVGSAARDPTQGLQEAWQAADDARQT